LLGDPYLLLFAQESFGRQTAAPKWFRSWNPIPFNDDSASLQLQTAGPSNSLRYADIAEPIDIEIGLDHRFISTGAWGQPMAARGAWLGDATFLIEYQFVGQAEPGTFEFTFSDDVAGMEFQKLTTDTNQWSRADRVD
jgi:hypothetical protein